MAKKIIVQSFRGGTGKSTIIANLAFGLARKEKRVAIIDADINSPGIHAHFGLDKNSFKRTFTDYLKEKCSINEVIYDIGGNIGIGEGRVFLLPSSISGSEIADNIGFGYDNRMISKSIKELSEVLDVDYILIDTHPGINNEMLCAVNESDISINVIRPDNQDFQGAEVTTQISKGLGFKSYIVLNKVHDKVPSKTLTKKIINAFDIPVLSLIPYSSDLLLEGGAVIFSKEYPNHEFSMSINKILAEAM